MDLPDETLAKISINRGRRLRCKDRVEGFGMLSNQSKNRVDASECGKSGERIGNNNYVSSSKTDCLSRRPSI